MEMVELSGAATDVLHALFFRGTLVKGDLPSKAGGLELCELGLADVSSVTTRVHDGHQFSYLTPEGQACAISLFATGTKNGDTKADFGS